MGGFAHEDGWFDILWRFCEDLEPLVAAFEHESGFQFELLQAKEVRRAAHPCKSMRMMLFASSSKRLNTSPSILVRFSANRENCGKAVGSRHYATSMQRRSPRGLMSEHSHDRL